MSRSTRGWLGLPLQRALLEPRGVYMLILRYDKFEFFVNKPQDYSVFQLWYVVVLGRTGAAIPPSQASEAI